MKRPPDTEPPAKAKGGRTWVKAVQVAVGLAIAVGIVWLMFRGTDWDEVAAAFSRIHYGWLSATMGAILLSFFTRVMRWRYIVRSAKPVRYRALLTATQLGFLVNFSVPLRVGELVRAWALARLGRLPLTQSLAFSALDRVTDLIGLVVVVLITLIGLPVGQDFVLPAGALEGVQEDITIKAAQVRTGALIIGAACVALVAALVVMYVKQDLAVRMARAAGNLVSTRIGDTLALMVRNFAEGLHIFRSVGDMAKSVAWSLVTWSMFLVSLYTILRAFGLEGPWYTVFAIQSLLSLFVATPIAPGLVGQFHLPIYLGIMTLIPEATREGALAVAILAHILNVAAVALLGLLCLALDWRRLFRGATVEEAVTEVEEALETERRVTPP